MKLSRRSLFGTLLVTPLMATAGEPVATNESYSMQKVRDIVDMLATQLIQKFEEDDIRYPADHTTPSKGHSMRWTAVPITGLFDSIDQILSHKEWLQMRNALSSAVRKYDGAEASHCKVLVYTMARIPNHLIFEFRAFKLEDNWPIPTGLLYYRHARVTT